MNTKTLITAGILAMGLNTTPAMAQDDALLEAMQDYLMFADYNSGVISPQQIDQSVFEAAAFIDTRDAAQYAESTIPGATNIEWRSVIDRLDEIPDDQMTILFCNTGSLSAQATFALRLAGRGNVLVLQGGKQNWDENAAWKPE